MVKSSYNFIRVGIGIPVISVANPRENKNAIINIIEDAKEKNVGLLIFPQLAITGVSCGDLFFQQHLYKEQEKALKGIIASTSDSNISVLIGHYKEECHKYVNGFSLIENGEICAFREIPISLEQERWFYKDLKNPSVNPITSLGGITFGTCKNAHIQIAFSANHQLTGRENFNRNKVVVESGENKNCYVFVSPSLYETSSDKLYGGKSYIAECGKIIAESESFSHNNQLFFTDVDFGKISYIRRKTQFDSSEDLMSKENMSKVSFLEAETLLRKYSQKPFLPEDSFLCQERCEEILKIQSHALAMRIKRANSKKTIVGISGGLDSTMALLVTSNAYKILNKPASDIIGVTMPGFGTTGKTYNNALSLIKELGATPMELSIKNAMVEHFENIGQDLNCHDVTYENAQARERTQILMDLANKEGGFVVGTGDLSEEALGWCTYSGDHMAMYNVNSTVPKTVIRELVSWVMKHSKDNLAFTLKEILDTPISPELLPPDENDNISQITEDKLGPYELHDFFIYHTLHNGTPPDKLFYIATIAFKDVYEPDFIKKWIEVFYKRFFSQQFKRTCAPDGIGIGSISLSIRGDFIMPADISSSAWLDAIK